MVLSKNKKYILIGLIIVIMLFSYLEFLHPYNFTKDDNLAQFLPTIIEGMEQLFSGDFPSVNLHQFMGVKIFEVGTYAVLYPLMILSYFLSHYIFHNDFFTIEIFVLIHLILAFIVAYLFINSKTKNELISLLASIAFIFSGYVIIGSANWYYVVPTALFLPLILLLDDYLLKDPTFKKAIVLGAVRGIYFYSGNAQYFAFTLIFEFLYLLSMCKRRNWENIKGLAEKYVFSAIFTIAIAIPLLVPQLLTVNDSLRGSRNFIGYIFSLPSSPSDLFLGSIISYPLVHSSSSFGYSGGDFISIYYSGALFSIIFFIGLFYSLYKYKWKIIKKSEVITNMAVLSIILSIGYFGLVYLLGAFLPVIKNFSSPFKITLFTNFFTIVAGGMFASKFLINKEKGKKLLYTICVVLFSLLLIYHLSISHKVAWSSYGDKLPLNTSLFKELNLSGGRFVSVFTNSSHNPSNIKYSNYTSSFPESYYLSQNFATYYGLDHISGYEPFIDKLTEEKIPISRTGLSGVTLNISSLEEYGVMYVIVPHDSLSYHNELVGLETIYKNSELSIIKLPSSKAYVFYGGGSIPYNIDKKSLSFETNFSSPNIITINLLYKKDYLLRVDGEKYSYGKDSLGRIAIDLPSGYHDLVFKYDLKKIYLFLLLSFFIIACLSCYCFFTRKSITPKIISKRDKDFQFIIRWWMTAALIIFVILLFLFLLKNQILRPSSIEGIINERTALGVSIGKISDNLLTGTIAFYDVSVSNSFHADSIIIYLSYYQTVKNTMKFSRPQVIFKTVEINGLSINSSLHDRPATCINPLAISVNSNYYNKSLVISSDRLVLDNVRFIPLNKAYLSFNSSVMINRINNSLKANISVEKYISGSVDIGEGSKNHVNSCISLPLKSDTILYY
ncbi:MAG: hypothetical protein AABW73_03640 [Nanoarchaeota archaeon]